MSIFRRSKNVAHFLSAPRLALQALARKRSIDFETYIRPSVVKVMVSRDEAAALQEKRVGSGICDEKWVVSRAADPAENEY